MKKFKHIIVLLLALIMAITIPLAACDSCSSKKKTLQSISLNTDNVKKEYLYGETFTAEGLVVTAVILNTKKNTTEEITLEESEYTVVSGSFRSDYASEYTITVSYTYRKVTKTADYNVTVSSGLLSIALDTSKAKTLFYTGDSYSSAGLVVTAKLINESEPKTVAVSDCEIDTSAFDNTKAGKYDIKVSYTAQGATKTAVYQVKVIDILDRIELNLANVTTKFYTDKNATDTFNTDGVAATAYIWNRETNELESKAVEYKDLKIDDSAYKEELGEYPIVVSYTYQGITKSATYTVSFLKSMDGLFVEVAENTFTIPTGQTEIEITVSNIVVKEANRDGSIGQEVSGYTIQLFKGQEEITLTGGATATVGKGTYNVFISKASDRHEGYVRTVFYIIEVK